MPLHDHFHKPLRKIAPWTTLHGAWVTTIMAQLNRGGLPPGYLARQHVNLGTALQIDLAAVDESEEEETIAPNGDSSGGVALTAVWAPSKPSAVVRTAIGDLDVLEIRIFLEDDMELVAAIELISPANKDRPDSRAAFVSKIAGYFQEKIGVIIVDTVTDRQSSLHTELMELLSATAEAPLTSDLYAVAYRCVGTGKRSRVEMWTAALALGEPLPVLPLWIAADRAVPVDLDASYSAACEDSGMR